MVTEIDIDIDNELLLVPLPYPQKSLDLFQKIRHLPLPVLLESGRSSNKSARFDILTAAPDKILRSTDGKTVIEHADGTHQEANTDNPIDILAQQFNVDGFKERSDPDLPFTGGALGYFSYELLHQEYQINPKKQNNDIDLPEMLVGIYYWTVIVDHKKQSCTLVLRPQCSEDQQSAILQCLCEPAITPLGEFTLQSKFISNFTETEYQQAYQHIIDYIYAGDCYQVNLAQRYSAQCQGDPLHAFQTLQASANAPFSAYIEDGNNAVLSFSPERFIKVNDKEVMTQPIKGTRPRHSDKLQDLKNLNELKNSPKDKAENLMIVDLLRNDLGKVCQTGSVSVENLFEAQSFTNVHHLVSTIKSRLTSSEDVFSLFKSSFPGGSITGTPKKRAMEIIDELENTPRSVYCGSVAYFDFNGNMDSSICIRSLVFNQQTIHCWGGGAIVADSLADQEYQETIDKISLFINGL